MIKFYSWKTNSTSDKQNSDIIFMFNIKYLLQDQRIKYSWHGCSKVMSQKLKITSGWFEVVNFNIIFFAKN